MNSIPKIIIQARVGSTRLPSKMILPFYKEEGIFSILTDRLLSEFDRNNIILATSNSAKDDVLEQIASSKKIHCYRGSESDVLQRFIDAASHFDAKKIIRVCADNPFLDLPSLRNLYNNLESNDLDYIAYATSSNTPTIKTHYGFWAEGTCIDTLQKIKEATTESLYHEHVTNFIYTHPDLFKIKLMTIPIEIENHQRLRLTIDTANDFAIQKSIFKAIFEEKPSFTAKDVCNYLDKNPEYYTTMENEIIKNQK